MQYELGPSQEYARLYSRMSALILSGESEVNVDPLIVVADIFMIGTRHVSVPFNF